jgi:serine/threonine protein kinase
VHRATDATLGRDVALTLVAEGFLERRDARETFLRDARAAVALSHPNVAAVYDAGTLDGRTFVTSELVEGARLDAFLAEQKKLAVPEALRVTAQVLAALEHAHGRAITHRDVRPANMIRARGGAVKLTDFVVARSLNPATSAYMPPEQLAGRAVDHRADLYAVGASLYEMLSGETPFETNARTAPPSLRARFPEVPAAIDDALRVVMDPDPARRYQSAKDFLAPVQRVLAVIERAVEERESRRSHPDRPMAVPVVAAAPRPAAVTRPKPTTAIMEEPIHFASKAPLAMKHTPPNDDASNSWADLSADGPRRAPSKPHGAARPLSEQLEDPQLRPRPKATLSMHASDLPQPAAQPNHPPVESPVRHKATLAMSPSEAPQPYESVRPAAAPSQAPSAMGVASTRPPAPSTRPGDTLDPFKSRKGTLMMHAASSGASDAAPSQMPPVQPPPVASRTHGGTNRWITRPLPARSEPPRRRSTSTLPPPA